jgi:hypothetical protein
MVQKQGCDKNTQDQKTGQEYFLYLLYCFKIKFITVFTEKYIPFCGLYEEDQVCHGYNAQ